MRSPRTLRRALSLAVLCGAAATLAAPTDGAAQGAAPAHRNVFRWNPDPRSGSTPAPAGAHLTYYGGRVVSNLQVVGVLWGTGVYLPEVTSSSSPSIATFFQGVLNSGYVDWLDPEYNTSLRSFNGTQTSQRIGRGAFVGWTTITPSVTGLTIDDSVIQSELSAQIAGGKLPAPTHDAQGNPNTYYAIYFPSGITITQGGFSSCVSGGFCSYHGTIANALGFGEVYYGVHPDMGASSGCATGCGNDPTPFNNYTVVASHELMETITDPEVGLAVAAAPPLAWYDGNNGEVADICNGIPDTVTGSDAVVYHVQQVFSNALQACIATKANDFSLSVTPATQTATQGGAAVDYIVATAVTAGTSETVSLSVAGVPSGATAIFTPASAAAGSGSTLAITPGSAAPGSYPLTVYATSASATQQATITLVVNAVGNDFSIAATPASASAPQGGPAAQYTVSTTLTSGSAQQIALSVSGLPAGASASFTPPSIASGASAVLAVTPGTAAVGSYTLTLTGTGTAATHSTTVIFGVTAPNDFSMAAAPSSQAVTQGGAAAAYTIVTAVTSGSAETIAFAVSGAPAGSTVSLSPASVPAGGSTTLTVSPGTAAVGSYVLTITGTAPSATHQATVTVVVDPPPGDFSVSASPFIARVRRGRTAQFTVTTAVTSGAPQTVALSASGLPAGTTATFTPASVTAGGSSALSIPIPAGEGVGLSMITITATGTTATHTTRVLLLVW
jgi:uncharacterized membrane protein